MMDEMCSVISERRRIPACFLMCQELNIKKQSRVYTLGGCAHYRGIDRWRCRIGAWTYFWRWALLMVEVDGCFERGVGAAGRHIHDASSRDAAIFHISAAVFDSLSHIDTVESI